MQIESRVKLRSPQNIFWSFTATQEVKKLIQQKPK